ncbi:hypothetical protein [Planococcus sp. SSTMD024]|uniref:hypothetical protein n=1 Tax=Planococcus sp. SSTMD024 TaxID=3242163 RepID=UPI00351DC574
MKYFLFEADELELNLLFSPAELRDFQELWQAGISMTNIAKKMRRKPSEIALLVFDHAERGLIQKRETGIFGL